MLNFQKQFFLSYSFSEHLMQKHTALFLLLKKKNEHEVFVTYASIKKKIGFKKTQGSLTFFREVSGHSG